MENVSGSNFVVTRAPFKGSLRTLNDVANMTYMEQLHVELPLRAGQPEERLGAAHFVHSAG